MGADLFDSAGNTAEAIAEEFVLGTVELTVIALLADFRE
jgi:Na+/H+-translocating membrane pyrophosphatase